MAAQYPHLRSTTPPARRAMALLYVVILYPLFIGICVLAVDVGRMQLARTQLQSAADAAVRYAVSGMQSSSNPMTTARANANAVIADSIVDGAAPTLNSADLIRGSYNSTTKVFTTNSTGDSLQITIHQHLKRTGAAPLWVSVLGNTDSDLSATAVAKSASTSTTINPPASGNLWLAASPDNTTFQNFRPDNSTVWDNSGTSSNSKQRPLVVSLSSLGLAAGDSITLEGVSGTASWQNSSDGSNNTADGDPGMMCCDGVYPANTLSNTSANGISNVRAPIGAVMAVFLSADAPNATSAPSSLDFNTQDQRDYTTISPELKQVFFVGDGKKTTGESQTIIVPPGATRIFLGMMDAWQWNDNVGTFTTNLYGHNAVQLVK